MDTDLIIIFGSVVNLKTNYLNGNSYLDTRGQVKSKGQFSETAETEIMFVSTNQSSDRENGSGSWKIISATGKSDGDALLYGDKIHLLNMFDGGAGYLDSWGLVEYMEAYRSGYNGAYLGVFTTESTDRDNGSGTWIVESSDLKIEGSPVLEGDNILLNNGYTEAGHLFANGLVTNNPVFEDYSGQEFLVFLSHSSVRIEQSGNWIITNANFSNEMEIVSSELNTLETVPSSSGDQQLESFNTNIAEIVSDYSNLSEFVPSANEMESIMSNLTELNPPVVVETVLDET